MFSYEKHRLARQLHSRDYDAVFLLESAPRYRQLLLHAGITRIAGFSETAFDPEKHCIANYLNVVGFPGSRPEDHQMDLPVAPADEAAADRLIGHLESPRIGLLLGYGPGGKNKNQRGRLKGWSRDNFLRLSLMLLDHGANLIFTGSVEDQNDIESIRRQLPQNRTRSTAGGTRVRELAAVLKKLDLFISVDTGPAHMAAALAVPMVVLWGPAIYEQVRPVSPSSPIRILRIPPQCAPCYGTPRKDSCKRNLCMENISPNSVLEAAQDLLSAGGKPNRVV
jgi:ADP-heptose:LPS heptosyltransferase